MPFKEQLIKYMSERAYKPMGEKELFKALSLTPADTELFSKALRQMESDGLIVKNRRNRYATPERMGLVVGSLQMNARGFGFLIPQNPDIKDVFIGRDDLNTALNGDLALVRPKPKTREGKVEGEVLRVLKRVNKRIVGTVERDRQLSFVIPDDKRFYWDIFVPPEKLMKAKTGQKVVAKIIKWPERRRNPEGEIVEILGRYDEPGIDILSIIKAYDLPMDFPAKVEGQLEGVADIVRREDMDGREDFRDEKVFTIDGADAKDLDDAVSIKRLDGGYRLGVHIADVSHYVREKSPLDVEALKRGTSVYLVDQMIPMLPGKLSNGICSLNPGEDRLTLSVVIEFDKGAQVKDYKIVKGVIRSDYRTTYDEIMLLLDEDKQTASKYADIAEDVKVMAELAEKLTQKRFARGSMDFNIAEAKVILDDQGHPVDVIKEERKLSHRIIEEFMLIANEVVAEHIYWLKVPAIYRVHEDPDEAKIFATREILYNLGYTLKATKKISPKTLQQILKDAEGKPEERLVNTLLLRSLKQARYNPENLGHFGLSARFYTHFTAPIRRYPDLTVHRILTKQLQNIPDTQDKDKLYRRMEKIARISSERERIADEAERESTDLKVAEYMSQRIGEIYDGIVSSVTSFGIFIELPNTVEGLVHVSNIPDDFYHYDERNLTLTGEKTKRVFRIGDPVTIKVSSVNVQEKNIDFELVETP